jgi:hypothetical protein
MSERKYRLRFCDRLTLWPVEGATLMIDDDAGGCIVESCTDESDETIVTAFREWLAESKCAWRDEQKRSEEYARRRAMLRLVKSCPM